jgi:hypothetical protein
MRIFNQKLAKRIRANDDLLTRLTYRLVTCDMSDFNKVKHEMFIARRDIITDESTLRQAGYDRKGNKVR